MKKIKYFISLCMIMLALPVMAGPKYIEGKDYTRLSSNTHNNPAISELVSKNPNKVQLLLFFSFGCPACAKFDPTFEHWADTQSNSKLVIYREPVSFEDDWEDLAKLYYVSQDLKPNKNLNAAIFKAIHQENLKLWHEPVMEEFFIAHGYNGADVKKAYDSYDVEMQTKRADNIAKAYNINQTPCIIINGPEASYLLTIDQANGDKNNLMKIADYLINMETKKIN